LPDSVLKTAGVRRGNASVLLKLGTPAPSLTFEAVKAAAIPILQRRITAQGLFSFKLYSTPLFSRYLQINFTS
jgi:hypothetical protein